MSLPQPPSHSNCCVKCGSSITEYHETRNSASSAEVAYCNNCEGYPCYCYRSNCGYGAFIVRSNPLRNDIKCPDCYKDVGAVQIKDGWW